MAVLIFDETIKEQIAQAIAEARKNPLPFEELKKIGIQDPSHKLKLSEELKATSEEIYKRYPTQKLKIGNVRVAFNYEQQPTGLYRHISFSIHKKGRVLDFIPSEVLVKKFGFSGLPPTNTYRIWTEEYDPGMFAINVIELEEEAGHNGSEPRGGRADN